MRLLCACALSAPSKSDLQQADIVIVRDKAGARPSPICFPRCLGDAGAGVPGVPRQRAAAALISQKRGKPFPNDHLDLFFNATVDAAIVLATFLRAAEAVGLGCCPISVIRDHAAKVSDMLALPDKVIPIAGMCIGWPAEESGISARLSLATTVHEEVRRKRCPGRNDAYDRRRDALRPYRNQRKVDRFGRAEFYGWSEDKARQYSKPARADFGAFVRGKGFRLE